ncbi:MAG: inositol monophosphatase family protein [Gemmatimonadaceae bacterium]
MPESTEGLMHALEDIAKKAGDVALQYFGRPLSVERKEDGSPVTNADRAVEDCIRAWIESHFPHDGIVGEERGALRESASRRWLVDPIDGTKSFLCGVPLWGVMIGVASGDRMLAGAINCAGTGDIVVAAAGCGCWHNGRLTRVSGINQLGDATVLATDDRFREHPDRIPRWSALASQAAIARTWGDCYGYVLVATGRADVMVDDRLNPWDAAPLIPIISEAGGCFTDWNGETSIEMGDGIATNAELAVTARRALGLTIAGDR